MSLPYPVVVFYANLTPSTSEAFGPKTNQTIQGTDSPDNIVDAQNQTLLDALKAQRHHDRSTFMPAVANVNVDWSNVLVGPEIIPPNPNKVKHGDIFIVAGQPAIDTLKLYCNKATILTYLPGYQGEGAAPGFDILTVGYYGVDPGILPNTL